MLKFEIDVKGLDEALKAASTLSNGVNPQVINLWVKTIETTARRLCNDKTNNIELEHTKDKLLRFSYKDEKSKQCLARAIQANLNSMPVLLQGVFRKLHEDIRTGRFNH